MTRIDELLILTTTQIELLIFVMTLFYIFLYLKMTRIDESLIL